MKKTLFLICLIFSFLTTQAQDGIIEYQLLLPKNTEVQIAERVRKVKEQVADPDLQEMLIAKFKQNESIVLPYRLLFNSKISFWERANSGGPGRFNTIKTDFKGDTRTENAFIFEKSFLIEEKLPDIQWTDTGESRLIGPFKCKKAIAVTDSLQTVIWYTEDIPVPAGPEYLYGAKGLIIEAVCADGRKYVFKSFSPLLDKKNEDVKLRGTKISRAEFEQSQKEAIQRALDLQRKF